MKIKLLLLALILCVFSVNLSAKDLTIGSDFGAFTSQQAQGYLKPLFTTIEESWNTGLYTTARYNGFSLAIDLEVMGMTIPNSQKTYNAELPSGYTAFNNISTADSRDGNIRQNVYNTTSQPTLYGGQSTSLFVADKNGSSSSVRSLAFLEGQSVNSIPGVPLFQVILGTPLWNEFRIRYYSIPIESNPIKYYMIGFNQNIDKIFNLFKEEDKMGVAFNYAYHKFEYSPEISMTSWSAGLHFSKTWGSWFTFYLGAQMESISGKLTVKREQSSSSDVVNSPYDEVRAGKDLSFDISGFTKSRFGGGVSMMFGSTEIKADYYLASQPVASLGLSLWFFKPSEPAIEEKPIPMPLPKPSPKLEPNQINTTDSVKIYVPPAFIPKIKEITPDVGVLAFNDTPVKPKIIESPKIINIDIIPYSVIDSTTAELSGGIVIDERAMRHLTPILPYIFFEPNDYAIPNRYILLDSERVNSAEHKATFGTNTLGNYYQVLNIVGERLYKNPKSKITLTGTNCDFDAEMNNIELSQKRAESVKSYFVDVWGIDAKRITVKARNLPEKFANPKKEDGIQENRRVEISSDTYDVLEPCMIYDTARSIMPPMINFKTNVSNKAEIESWDFTVISSDKTIFRASGKGEIPSSIPWDVGNDETYRNILKKEIKYFATIKLKNKETQASKVFTTPVSVTTDVRSLSSKLQVFDLVLFDFGKSTLTANNQKIVGIIKEGIKGASNITIEGHTDRIGDSLINEKLSTQRAQATKSALKINNCVVEGLGARVLLLDNNLPEGRLYSRNVSVRVETPKKEGEGE